MTIDRLAAWMWADACALLDRAERLQRTAFAADVTAGRPVWEPPADILSSGDSTRVSIALPGVDERNISVRVTSDALIVEAVRELPTIAPNDRIERLELPYGRFIKRLTFRRGGLRLARSVFDRGCLTLWLTSD